ncbi:hypothetical protein P171DRAFT_92066 [Karstenula rhodostoma CBS 690.94]|uniref:Uncharacterized protein n=1 Tax=Karstenula rhodostoma CBS 690.94 TaxID=1392251 RepID=A0A9P4U8S8_9PLEO|nr:hypothetical protein P171DRAFT_92066 [Karstenula rhodostoma CBS 690.94]
MVVSHPTYITNKHTDLVDRPGRNRNTPLFGTAALAAIRLSTSIQGIAPDAITRDVDIVRPRKFNCAARGQYSRTKTHFPIKNKRRLSLGVVLALQHQFTMQVGLIVDFSNISQTKITATKPFFAYMSLVFRIFGRRRYNASSESMETFTDPKRND